MFSYLTEPAYPKAALGINDECISAIALNKTGRDQFSVKQAATVSISADTLLPSFSEANILDPVEFSAAIMEAVEIAGLLGQKRWSVTLPSMTARSAILTLETVPTAKNELEEILDWKAEQSFGVPAVELRIGKKKISPNRSGNSRYFATAVRLTVIDEFETIFEGLGWKAGLILPRAMGEANWLLNNNSPGDSLLISSNRDGFTAILMRGSEPAVIRSIVCEDNEIDDEIFRLIMFYKDRFGGESAESALARILAIGDRADAKRTQEIAADALGRPVNLLNANDVGLHIPGDEIKFDDFAAPAGLAVLGFR